MKIEFPVNGRDDSVADGKASLLTTRDAKDVRVRNARTGKLTGARRAGTKKGCSVQVGTSGLRGLAQAVIDTRHVTRTALATPTTEATATGPSEGNATAVRVDETGDVYVLEGGTHVAIYNDALVLQDTIVLPVGDTGQLCRALAIDPILKTIYVGVSEGGAQSRATLWAYSRDPYRGWEVLWEIQPGFYVEKLWLRGNVLHAGANDTDSGRSYVVGFNALSTLAAEVWRAQVPAPITVGDVFTDGKTAVGSGHNLSRGTDPRHPGTGQILDKAFESWTFAELDAWSTRRWAEFDPEDLALLDGQEVFRWSDKHGTPRSFDATLVNVHLDGIKSTYGGSAVPANNDTLTFSLPDGSVTETYRWRTSGAGLAAAGDILIGANPYQCLVNLDRALDQGGDGVGSYQTTQPSVLAFADDPYLAGGPGGAAFFKLKANVQREVVNLATAGGGNFTSNVAQIASEKNVQGTAPKFKKNGMAGRPTIEFDGISTRMETLPNPNILVSGSGQHPALFPGWGVNLALASSARFAAFVVCKPSPQDWSACVVAQKVKLSSGSWTRRIVSNLAASGSYTADRLAVVERDGTAATNYTHDTAFTTAGTSNFNLVALISNPTGNYEVWINGHPAFRYTNTMAAVAFVWTFATSNLNVANIGVQSGGVSPTHVIITAGTGLTPGVYEIASRTDNNNVVLASSPSNIDAAAADFTGTSGIATGTAVANDSNFATFLGQFGDAGTGVERFWKGEIGHMMLLSETDASPVYVAERQIIEGRLHWMYGAAGLLPPNHPYRTYPPPPPGMTTSGWYKAKQALSLTPIVTRLDAKTRDIKWMLASDTANPGANGTLGGLGYGLAWNSDGDLYSVGPPVLYSGAGSDTASVRKIVDLGDSGSTATTDGAWSVTLGSSIAESFDYDKLELAVDSFDHLYVPFHADSYTSGYPPLFLMYDEDGTEVLSPDSEEGQAAFGVAIQKPLPDLTGTTIERPEFILVACRREFTSTLTAGALPSDGDTIQFVGTVAGVVVTETYRFKTALAAAFDVLIDTTAELTLSNLKAATWLGAGSGTKYHAGTTRSQLVTGTVLAATDLTFASRGISVVATSSTGALIFSPANPNAFTLGTGSLRKMRLLETVARTDSSRLRVVVAVSGTDLKKFGLDYAQTTTGGAGVFDANARYIHSVTLHGRTYTTDGTSIYVFDGLKDKTERFSATKGSTPQNVQILEGYRARLVHLGTADATSRVLWSASGDAHDYDYQPAVRKPGQAWNSGLPPTFDIPDVLNGYAAESDDLAIIFGDHTIARQTGDPAPGGNGQYDPFPTQIGGAFGRAWCKGPAPNGVGSVIYFWGTDSRLYFVVGSSGIYEIQGNRLRDWEELDLSRFYVRMAWNSRQNELDIIAAPFGGVTERTRYFAWERSTNALWEDTRLNADHDAYDVIVYDGDKPDDRMTLFGCKDGYARTWDEGETADDDGSAIHAYATLGPFAFNDAQLETRLSRLQVLLDRKSGDCFVEVWASDVPSERGRVRQIFTLRPGMGGVLPANVSANYVWLVLRGTQPWAFEAATAMVSAGGMKRRRVAR